MGTDLGRNSAGFVDRTQTLPAGQHVQTTAAGCSNLRIHRLPGIGCLRKCKGIKNFRASTAACAPHSREIIEADAISYSPWPSGRGSRTPQLRVTLHSTSQTRPASGYVSSADSDAVLDRPGCLSRDLQARVKAWSESRAHALRMR